MTPNAVEEETTLYVSANAPAEYQEVMTYVRGSSFVFEAKAALI